MGRKKRMLEDRCAEHSNLQIVQKSDGCVELCRKAEAAMPKVPSRNCTACKDQESLVKPRMYDELLCMQSRMYQLSLCNISFSISLFATVM